MLRRCVAANVAYALELAGVPRRAHARTRELLRQVGLALCAHRPARRALGRRAAAPRARARAGRAIPKSCFSTSRPPASIRPPRKASRTSIRAVARRAAPRSSWPRTISARRGALPATSSFSHRGRLVERAAADALLRRAATAEARGVPARRSASERRTADAHARIATRRRCSSLALGWSLPRACAGQIHHRRLDHLDAASGLFGYLLPMFKAKTGIDVQVIAHRHRPGARHRRGAAMPTWCSCTPSRRKRIPRRRLRREALSTSCTTTSC